MSSAARTILSGDASEHDLASILEASSIGRQVLRLEVLGPSGAVVGHLVMKGGKIVSASAGALHGMRALMRLSGAADKNARFRILNVAIDAKAMGAPLGSISIFTDLLSKGGERKAESAIVPTARRSVPVVPRLDTVPPSRIPMMAGTLADVDVATLLRTVSLGRQFVELEVQSPAGEVVGTLSLKSGHIVSAQAKKTDGVKAVYELLSSPRTSRFSVFRLNPPSDSVEPIGTVNQLVAGQFKSGQQANDFPTSTASSGSPGVPVMEGLLSDFHLADVLQTLGLGRQHTRMIVSLREKALGTIEMKAGKVLSASSGHRRGIEAVHALLAAPTDARFLVLRLMEGTGALIEPIGSVGHILMQALTEPAPMAVDAPSSTIRPTATTDEPIPVMEGKIGEVDLSTLLETVGLSRQFTSIEIHAGRGEIGMIFMKAGMIVSAVAGQKKGIDALAELLGSGPNMNFRVSRHPRMVESAAEPLGPLVKVLLRIHKSAASAGSIAPPAPSAKPSKVAKHTVEAKADVQAHAKVKPSSAPAANVDGETRARSGTGRRVAFGLGSLVAVSLMAFVARGVLQERPSVPVSSSPTAPTTATGTAAAPHTDTDTLDKASTATESTSPAKDPGVTPPTAHHPTRASGPTAPTQPAVTKVQAVLKDLQFDPGKVDGIHGPRTRAALEAFQKANGLTPTGTLTPETIKLLEEKRALP